MNLLAGKTALITGASKGIGKKIAELFAAQGANVAFTYLSSVEKGEALAKELAATGANVKGYRSDASDFNAAEQLINDIVADFGTIDIVVNNAGITKDGLLMRMTEAQWDEVMTVNLKSIFNVTKAASKVMMRQRSGVIMQHLKLVLLDLLNQLHKN
jgi:3-oxoacyl-[acyl-carrier protein] reductase